MRCCSMATTYNTPYVYSSLNIPVAATASPAIPPVDSPPSPAAPVDRTVQPPRLVDPNDSMFYHLPAADVCPDGPHIDWAAARHKYVFLDLETTGLCWASHPDPAAGHASHTGANHSGSRITELAAYCPATGQGMATLLHIGDKQVPESITAVTGITNDMVHQPHLPKIWYGVVCANRCMCSGLCLEGGY